MSRTGSDIGRGISPARAAKTLSAADRLHVVGVGGVAAMGAALHAAALGVHVTGVDDRMSLSAERILRDAGVVLVDVRDVSPLMTTTSLAVSKAVTSIRPDHPQLEAARAIGVPIISVQQVIAGQAAGEINAGVPIQGGGDVIFRGYDDGVVLLELQGAGYEIGRAHV